MLHSEKCAKPKPKRRYQRYGGLVKIAARLSGKATSTVYAVLRGHMTSAVVSEAITRAKRELQAQAAVRSAE